MRIAVEAGYRHIDTAVLYKNEAEIGNALTDLIKRGVVKREDVFVTTKVCEVVGESASIGGICIGLYRVERRGADRGEQTEER